MTYPKLKPETVAGVSLLRGLYAEAEERDALPDPQEVQMLVHDLVRDLTPDFQSDSVPRRDDRGTIIDVATCGTCGRSWDDALGSSVTPAPSGRCPFEYDHEDEDERIETAIEMVAQMNERLDAYAMPKVAKDDVRPWLKAIVHTLGG